MRALVLKHNLGDPLSLAQLKDTKSPDKPPLPKMVPTLNLTGGLKPISETYGDESDDEEKPAPTGFNLGMPAAMSKTFDSSVKVVPKLDFRKLKHVKEQKDWYGYQEKLESNIRFLQDKIHRLENSEYRTKFNQLVK